MPVRPVLQLGDPVLRLPAIAVDDPQSQEIRDLIRDLADTLAHWAVRFGHAWDDVRRLGFDDRFRRLWLFYLAYCEAGFRTGRIDVMQFTAAKA